MFVFVVSWTWVGSSRGIKSAVPVGVSATIATRTIGDSFLCIERFPMQIVCWVTDLVSVFPQDKLVPFIKFVLNCHYKICRGLIARHELGFQIG